MTVSPASGNQLGALINSFIVEDDSEAQQKFAKSLAKSFSLFQIVKGLEDPLTQEDGLVRAKATQCLADVIVYNDELNSQELQVLTVFLSDRLHDQESISAAAQGLRYLCSKPAYPFPDDEKSEFWEKLKDVDMLQLDASVKYEVFLLLEGLSNAMSTSFVTTFLALAGGEKDPRNLMLNLKTSRRILEAMGSQLAQDKRAEIYDITFCYFPVKFHPPKDMPYKITGAAIKDALQETLSSPALSEWAIPGFISKLTAVNVEVKKDALAGLNLSLEKVAQSGDIQEYWALVWDGIKYEILHGTPENETYQPSITVLTQFVGIPDFVTSLEQEFDADPLPRSKLSQLCNLVVAISINETVWSALAPKAVEKSFASLEALNILLSARFSFPHADQILQTLQTGLANGDKRESLNGLKRLALNSSGAEFVPFIVQTLTQEAAYDSLAEIANVHPTAVKEHCLPTLISEIPNTLDALAQICCVRPLVEALAVRLLSRLDLNENSSVTAKILNTLVVSVGHLKSSTDLLGFDRVLIPSLFEKFREVHAEPTRVDESIIDSACILVERAAQGVPPSNQGPYVAAVIKNVGKLHFHLILSAVAAMKDYPFTPGFIQLEALPRFRASRGILERAAYLRLIALVANKWPENLIDAPNDLKSYSHSLKMLVKDKEKRDPSILEVFTWLTKGLLFRTDSQGFDNASFLVEEAPFDPQIAKVFGALVAEDRVLSRQNGCVVRPLFRQRLFVMSLSNLTSHKTSIESLAALSSLLRYTPQSVLASYFDRILPMLISSLETESARLQATALDTLRAALPGSAETLAPKVPYIILRVIGIATSATSAATRVSALKTIIAFKTALPAEMSDFQAEIVDKLEPALGDQKREVRKHAVKCRQLFY